MESSYATIDDIVDNSLIRSGKLCWYRMENVGLSAIFDSFYMENAVFYILRKYFSNHPQYFNLLQFIWKANFKTIIGQCLDTVPRDLKDFTSHNYYALVNEKAGYSSIYTSIAAAMFLANISDRELHQQTESLLKLCGIYSQIQNDFLDCYGDPQKSGKIGNDIREGKFTWLAMTAFQKASSGQKILMQENYGIDEDSSFQIVRNLYDELKLMEEYRRWGEQMYNNIRFEILQLSENLPHTLFYNLLEKVHDEKWLF